MFPADFHFVGNRALVFDESPHRCPPMPCACASRPHSPTTRPASHDDPQRIHRTLAGRARPAQRLRRRAGVVRREPAGRRGRDRRPRRPQRHGQDHAGALDRRAAAAVVGPGQLQRPGRSTGMPAHRVARLGIALVPEGRQIFPNLSVEEHLSAFVRAAPAAQAAWGVQRVFELFPRLAERRHHMGNQLSGGEQQMLAIGRALVTNPKLLILDEATEGLAPLVREEIWRVLGVLRAAGHAMIVIDKYVQRLIEVADRHVIVEKGRVVWRGTSQQLDADRELWQRYLGL